MGMLKRANRLICFFSAIYSFTDFLIVHYSTKLFCLATLIVNLSPPLLSPRLSLPLGFQDGSWDFAFGSGLIFGLVHESWFLTGVKVDASGPRKVPFSLKDLRVEMSI